MTIELSQTEQEALHKAPVRGKGGHRVFTYPFVDPFTSGIRLREAVQLPEGWVWRDTGQWLEDEHEELIEAELRRRRIEDDFERTGDE